MWLANRHHVGRTLFLKLDFDDSDICWRFFAFVNVGTDVGMDILFASGALESLNLKTLLFLLDHATHQLLLLAANANI